MSGHTDHKSAGGLTRRDLLLAGTAGLLIGSGLLLVPKRYFRMPQRALPPRQSYRFQRKLLETFGDRGIFEVGWPVVEAACDGSLRRLAPASTSP